LKINKKDAYFIIKASLFYCVISLGFSFSSILLPDKVPLINPLLYGINAKEIIGHILWGFVAATVTLRLKYVLLGGAFAVLIDSDHVIDLLQIEGISRMSHSIAFAGISLIVMMLVFRKRDYILGAVAAASVLSHISYDLFVGDTFFPLFTPIYSISVHLRSVNWIFFEIVAMVIMGVVALLVRKNALKTRQELKK
jgi:hypothetical protein